MTVEPWDEYDSAAEWCARHNSKGGLGDPLPVVSVGCSKLIDDDPEAFEEHVRRYAYAVAMERLNLPEDTDGH